MASANKGGLFALSTPYVFSIAQFPNKIKHVNERMEEGRESLSSISPFSYSLAFLHEMKLKAAYQCFSYKIFSQPLI